jgi:hypothetical protein
MNVAHLHMMIDGHRELVEVSLVNGDNKAVLGANE